MSENIRHFRDLRVYQSGMEAVISVFDRSKGFPDEEKYSLTDQIRRSSRSVCANLAEAWRKRRYPRSFVSKLNDAEAEAAETQVWLEVAQRHGYISQQEFDELDLNYENILGMLVKMAAEPSKWTIESK
jgi:four helix bundle protein